MSAKDLSVLIPSRNEQFLKHTIDDVLAAIRADTEVIAVCDGALPVEPIPDHPRVKLVLLPKSIGQRAAINLAARLSKAKYIMKLDAHCRVSEGFDAAMIKDCQPTWTMVPTMYNLHVFDWQCKACGHRTYQGRTPEKCESCKKSNGFERVMVWQPRKSRRTDVMRFDRNLHFQYWRDCYNHHPEIKAQGDLHDTMSIVGACWFLERERYWYLGGSDEQHGSWGQQGTEIACKTWLSGGRLVVTKRAWFAHLFRTQGGDFGFPYEMRHADQEHARRHSQNLWLNDKWPQATRPLSWLIEKFKPIPDWHPTPSTPVAPAIIKPPREAGIVYYTDCVLTDPIAEACQRQLRRAANGHHIVSVSLGKAIDFGDENIIVNRQRGPKALFLQILAGLERSTADHVFFAEHDVLMPKETFEFVPERDDVFYYNTNMVQVSAVTGRAVSYRTKQLSALCANRLLLVSHYYRRLGHMAQSERELIARGKRVKLDAHNRDTGYEPGNPPRQRHKIDDYQCATFSSKIPYVDIREHGTNWTPTRWSPAEFKDPSTCEGWYEFGPDDELPGWPGRPFGRFNEWLMEIMSKENS